MVEHTRIKRVIMVSEICKQYNIYGARYEPVFRMPSLRLLDKDGCAYMFVPHEVELFNSTLRIFNKLGVTA